VETIRAARMDDMSQLVAYIADHVSDNGAGATALFMPSPRGTPFPLAEKLESWRRGLALAVDEPGWRRFWLAHDASGAIAGHSDLRGRPDACTLHRAILGIGVHRDHRRRGLGKRLLDVALDWARAQPSLAWVDLDLLASNRAAATLYARAGFERIATTRDMFRIDGDSVDHITMTLRLSRANASPGRSRPRPRPA
jgi:RimJ/RimL family protein N-acetyltransferase